MTPTFHRNGTVGNGTHPTARFNGWGDLLGNNQNPLLEEEGTRWMELVRNATSLRTNFMRAMMDPRRDVYAEAGYPDPAQPVELLTLQQLYDRDAIAGRAVELWPKERWRVQPEVVEDEDGSKTTAFEQVWEDLPNGLRGLPSWFKGEGGNPVVEALKRVDVLSGVGRYGVLVLGLDDGLPQDQPAAGVEEVNSLPLEPDGKGRVPFGKTSRLRQPAYGFSLNARRTTGRKLRYLRCFSELSAPVAKYEGNRNSFRFGKPVLYNVSFNDLRDQSPAGGSSPASLPPDSGTTLVHWTRVIHVADNLLKSSDDFGVPRLVPVLNDVLGLQKLAFSSPEGYWKACYNLLAFETYPELGGSPDVNVGKMKEMFELMMNGLQRWGTFFGGSLKSIAPTVSDPTAHVNLRTESICIRLECPVRVFKGSERGELASTQDDDNWNGRVRASELGHATPRVVAPFVDRLIMLGVLPAPGDGYGVNWPDLASRSLEQKATIATGLATALNTYAGPGAAPTVVAPHDFLTKFLPFSDDEAEAMLQAAADHAEEAQTQQMDQQRQMIDAGLAPDPTAPQQPPDGQDPNAAPADGQQPAPTGNTGLELADDDLSAEFVDVVGGEGRDGWDRELVPLVPADDVVELTPAEDDYGS